MRYLKKMNNLISDLNGVFHFRNLHDNPKQDAEIYQMMLTLYNIDCSLDNIRHAFCTILDVVHLLLDEIRELKVSLGNKQCTQ